MHMVITCPNKLNQNSPFYRNYGIFQVYSNMSDLIKINFKLLNNKSKREMVSQESKQILTVENVWRQPSKLHLILFNMNMPSCVRICRFMFFLSCWVPHTSQFMYLWQDWRWALRHSALENGFIQPGSQQIASTQSSLTASIREHKWLHVHNRKIKLKQ